MSQTGLRSFKLVWAFSWASHVAALNLWESITKLSLIGQSYEAPTRLGPRDEDGEYRVQQESVGKFVMEMADTLSRSAPLRPSLLAFFALQQLLR
ncbi:hypothetical protein BHE74_00036570 [Ensete ventricosum]|nr:hypothetical protein GW17_00050666 [Ensete ventricosum]RWW56693.1 hypothetical protein BHE74_00036570 [Ensete ventricosum]